MRCEPGSFPYSLESGTRKLYTLSGLSIVGLEYEVKRFLQVALLVAVPFLGVASSGQVDRGVDPAMVEAMKRCEAALATQRDDVDATPAACAEAVAWKLYVPKSKRIRPILILRQSLLA